MSSSRIDPPESASCYDCATRFTIPSRKKPHDTHVVELLAYNGNGMCDCKHFQIHLEPLLARSIAPETAFAQRLVKTKPASPRPEDTLRCFHIIEAYYQFGPMVVRAMSYAQKNTPPPQDTDCPF